MCPAQGPQRSDANEAQTPGPSVSSQASPLYISGVEIKFVKKSTCTVIEILWIKQNLRSERKINLKIYVFLYLI